MAGQSRAINGPAWVRLGNPERHVVTVDGGSISPPGLIAGEPYDLQFASAIRIRAVQGLRVVQGLVVERRPRPRSGAGCAPPGPRRPGRPAWCAAPGRARPRGSAAMAIRASARAATVCGLSVSVGSIMSASSTIEREVHRGGVEALLEQPLGRRRGPARPLAFFRAGRGGHELVHVGPVVRQVVGAPQLVAQPVGVEHGALRHPAQAVAAVGQDVGPGPGQGQGVAVPAVDPPDAAGRRRPGERAVGVALRQRARAGTRPGGRTPRPVRRPGRHRRGEPQRSCGGSCARCRSPCPRAGSRRGWR